MKSGSILGASYRSQANTSICCLRKATYSSLSTGDRCVPTWKYLSGFLLVATLVRLSQASAAPTLLSSTLATVSINCYNFGGTSFIPSGGVRWLIAAIRHYLVQALHPRISSIRPSVGNFTFCCRVDDMAPKACRRCSHGRARIAIYGEYASTTMKSMKTSSLSTWTDSLILPFGITIFLSNPISGAP